MRTRIATLYVYLAVTVIAVLAFSAVTHATEPIRATEPTQATDPIRVTVNGVAVDFADQAPVAVGGRTLVPVRGVFEVLGFVVEWERDTQQVTLRGDNDTVVIAVGSDTFTTNGESRTLDVPAQIIGGRTMLPIRAVLESVGYGVEWDEGERVVRVVVGVVGEQGEEMEIPEYVTIRDREYSTDLTYLDLSISGLTNEEIKPLRYMVNLTALDLSANQITDLSPLSNLINLTSLRVGHNQISDISPLTDLTDLTYLHIYINQISDISPLEKLTNLEGLYAGNNQIVDVSPLTNLKNLSILSLYGNQITDVSPLANLPPLRHFEIEGNPIIDRSPISHIREGFGHI